MDNVQNEISETDKSIAIFDNGSHASLAVALSRAEIDQQITTSRALPRSIEKAQKGILTLATLDRETAMECVYAVPRAGRAIKGPSIRMAEIIASQWGNCRDAARVVHVDYVEKYVEAEGVFHDLETNRATTSRVRRSLVGKNGRIFSDDMIIVTGNATCSIAKRNAILGGVPKAVWRKAYAKVEGVIAGDVQTLVARRDEAIKSFAHFGVKSDQVFAALGLTGLGDISIDHIIVLSGMLSALQSGEETVETMFNYGKAEKPPVANPLLPPVVESVPAEKPKPPAANPLAVKDPMAFIDLVAEDFTNCRSVADLNASLAEHQAGIETLGPEDKKTIDDSFNKAADALMSGAPREA